MSSVVAALYAGMDGAYHSRTVSRRRRRSKEVVAVAGWRRAIRFLKALSLSLFLSLQPTEREREKQRGSSQRISEKEGGGSEERREIIERLFAWFESVRESAIGSARTCAVNSGNVAPGAAPKNGRKIRTRDNWRPDEYRKSTRPTCPSWLKCTTNAALYDDTEWCSSGPPSASWIFSFYSSAESSQDLCDYFRLAREMEVVFSLPLNLQRWLHFRRHRLPNAFYIRFAVAKESISSFSIQSFTIYL